MSNKNARWGRITKAGADDQQFPVQQVEYLGKVADTFMVFAYGHHANVTNDALALILSVQGNPDNRAAIAGTPKDRPRLAEGEVAFYHPPTGALLVWKQNGDLEIVTSADVKVTASCIEATASVAATVTAPTINLVGNVIVTGNLDIAGTMKNDSINVGKTHVHPQGADSDNDTQQNTGVPQ